MSSSATGPQEPLRVVLEAVKTRVERRLQAFLDHAESQAERCAPTARSLVTVVKDLSLRGGKRLRAVLVHAAAAAIEGHFADIRKWRFQ